MSSNLEFPTGAALPPDAIQRRDFVKLLGASMALAGLSGCVRAPDEEIHPLVDAAPNSVPGVPTHYATAMTLEGFATGVIVESNDGRPTKIEGNPEHPASLGAAGVFEQASVLELYDPRRHRSGRHGLYRAALAEVEAAFTPTAIGNRVGARGGGLGLLLEPTASPLTRLMLERVQDRYPDAVVHYHAPLENAATNEASRMAFGEVLVPQHDFRHADVVVCLGADPLSSGPFHLRYARDFSLRRRESSKALWLVAETSPSPTSTLADARVAVSNSGMQRVAAALFATVVQQLPSVPKSIVLTDAIIALTAAEKGWVQQAAQHLVLHRGQGAVIAGVYESKGVQLLAHALNAVLDNAGTCVWYTQSPILEAGLPSHDIAAFGSALDSLDTVIVCGGNVCYSAPPDADVKRKFRALKHSLYVGSFDNETARDSGWYLPGTHYLEEWGIERAYDGTESIVQPLIAPMYGGRTVAEVLALVAGTAGSGAYALTREYWAASQGSADVGKWRTALQNGVVEGSGFPRVNAQFKWSAAGAAYNSIALGESAIAHNTSGAHPVAELSFTASRTVHDGRFGDNPWLQELPDPVTKLTWDNAALVAVSTAKALKVNTGDVVRLEVNAAAIEVPVLIVPGHAESTLSLALGYGRTGGEGIAHGVGVNVNILRSSTTPFALQAAAVRLVGRHRDLAVTQTHWSIEQRGESILGAGAMALPQANKRVRKPLTLYEPPAVSPNGFGADQWAMTIDLDQCTGCSACVVACQSENNIPVVGRDDVLKGREMHWMRIDRYVSDEVSAQRIDVQPMLCQHCEKAPCEYVCPVNATVHSDDGLNEMVYNRCVGTRFCSNNCPYKVRRFNWFEYNGGMSDVERMQKNPQVTVRDRGVMEKCTFCVQRIRKAQTDAQLAGEPHTGPVQTACQQTCPTQAIVFGSLTAADSEVAALSNHPRAFSALEELGTVPRVRYLTRTPRNST